MLLLTDIILFRIYSRVECCCRRLIIPVEKRRCCVKMFKFEVEIKERAGTVGFSLYRFKVNLKCYCFVNVLKLRVKTMLVLLFVTKGLLLGLCMASLPYYR